jgi:hypothetical protein
MKTLINALFVSAALVASSAYASPLTPEGDYPEPTTQLAGLTHAQVLAELQQAKAAGQVTFGESEVVNSPVAASSVTRAQVQAEAATAKANGVTAFSGAGYPTGA